MLLQLLPGDATPAANEGIIVVWDLLPAVLAGEAPAPLGPGAAAVFPLATVAPALPRGRRGV